MRAKQKADLEAKLRKLQPKIQLPVKSFGGARKKKKVASETIKVASLSTLGKLDLRKPRRRLTGKTHVSLDLEEEPVEVVEVLPDNEPCQLTVRMAGMHGTDATLRFSDRDPMTLIEDVRPEQTLRQALQSFVQAYGSADMLTSLKPSATVFKDNGRYTLVPVSYDQPVAEVVAISQEVLLQRRAG